MQEQKRVIDRKLEIVGSCHRLIVRYHFYVMENTPCTEHNFSHNLFQKRAISFNRPQSLLNFVPRENLTARLDSLHPMSLVTFPGPLLENQVNLNISIFQACFFSEMRIFENNSVFVFHISMQQKLNELEFVSKLTKQNGL